MEVGLWLISRTGIVIGSAPRVRVELNQRDALLVAPGLEGSLRASQMGPARLRYFSFCPELLSGLLTLPERHQLEKLATAMKLPQVLQASTAAARRFETLVAARNSLSASGLAERSSMLLLVSEVFAAELEKISDGAVAHVSYNRFDQLAARLTERELLGLNAKEMARCCNCSERHLKKLFRRKFGISLKRKQIKLRLQKASELLRDTDMKIGHVARDCDYAYPRAFEFAFKKEFGLNPSEWRLRSREAESQKTSGLGEGQALRGQEAIC